MVRLRFETDSVMGAALAIAFLSAAEAAILSAPATFYLRKQPQPVGEFDGVAAFGTARTEILLDRETAQWLMQTPLRAAVGISFVNRTIVAKKKKNTGIPFLP